MNRCLIILLTALTGAVPGAGSEAINPVKLVVDVSDQRLLVYRHNALVMTYPVSTSRYGVGNQQHSRRTPLGRHVIAQKIGAGQPAGSVFSARKPTGQIMEPELAPIRLSRDWITSRILWLDGMEPGVNRNGQVDSRKRFIYIHGTAEEGLIGQPASHGCVRMRNRDVIKLFDLVEEGTQVTIVP